MPQIGAGISFQQGLKAPVFNITAVAGYVAAYDFLDRTALWQNTVGGTAASSVSDPVLIAETVDRNADFQMTNTGGSVRPTVHAGGIFTDNASFQYLLASPATAVTNSNWAVFSRQSRDVASVHPPMFGASTSGGTDEADGFMVRTPPNASFDEFSLRSNYGALAVTGLSLTYTTMYSMEGWFIAAGRRLWIDGTQVGSDSSALGSKTLARFIIARRIIGGGVGNSNESNKGVYRRVAFFKDAHNLTSQNLIDIRAWLTA